MPTLALNREELTCLKWMALVSLGRRVGAAAFEFAERHGTPDPVSPERLAHKAMLLSGAYVDVMAPVAAAEAEHRKGAALALIELPDRSFAILKSFVHASYAPDPSDDGMAQRARDAQAALKSSFERAEKAAGRLAVANQPAAKALQ